MGPDEAHLFQSLAGRLLYSDRSLRASAERARAPRGRRGGAVGPPDLGRSPDRARADLGARGRRHRASAPAGPRLLADEAARHRPGDPERAGAIVRAGSPVRAGDAGPGEPVGDALRRWPAPRERLHPAGRSGDGRPAGRPAGGGASRALEPPGIARRPGRARAAQRGGRSRPAAPGRGPTIRGAPGGAGKPRVLQRDRRLRGGRRGVRDDSRRWAVDTGAVGERDRQPCVRLPGLRVGSGLHVVGQQPRAAAHPVVQRSGQRPAGGGHLRPGRGDRAGLGTDGASDPRGRRLRGPTRARLQPVRARGARGRAGAAAVRARRRSDQGLPAHPDEPIRSGPPALRDGLRGMGPWRVAERRGAAHRHRDRSGHRGAAGAKRVGRRRPRRPDRLCRPRRCPDGVDRRPDRVPRTARHPRASGGPRAHRAALRARGAGPRPVRGAPGRPSSSSPERGPRSSSSSATGRPAGRRGS